MNSVIRNFQFSPQSQVFGLVSYQGCSMVCSTFVFIRTFYNFFKMKNFRFFGDTFAFVVDIVRLNDINFRIIFVHFLHDFEHVPKNYPMQLFGTNIFKTVLAVQCTEPDNLYVACPLSYGIYQSHQVV